MKITAQPVQTRKTAQKPRPGSKRSKPPGATPLALRTIATASRERGQATESGRREPDYRRLPAKLCRRYKGASLEDVYDARVEQTEYGTCLRLVDCLPFQLDLIHPTSVEEAVLSELRLVHGIGPVTAALLRDQGVGRITDLLGHHRFGESAASLAQCWEQRDLIALHDLIRHRLAGAGHRLGVLLESLVPAERLVLVDLETLGLWGAPVFLFGFAHLSAGKYLEIHQYLARAGDEEPGALFLALERLHQCEAIVTYNGRTADMPWMRQRSAYFHIGAVPDRLHLDLLHPVRWRYRGPECDNSVLPDCRLPTVEASVLGIERDMDDVPSEDVPYFYREYERRRNIGPLVPIIDHNRADLVAVARLLALLTQDVTHTW